MQLTKRRLLLLSGSVGTTTALAGCTGGGEPSFELQRSGTQQSIITVDDTLTATATIENTGSGSGTASVTFNLDVSEKTEEIELGPGDAEQVVVDIEPPLVDSGRYDLKIELEEEQVDTIPIHIFDNIEEPGYYGALLSESDINLSNAEIRISADRDGEDLGARMVSVDEAHQFRLPGSEEPGVSLRITFRSTTLGEFDGVPAVSALTDEHIVSDSIEFLGPYEIPQAYRTEIQLVDQNENPVSNFNVTVRPANGSGIRIPTNENGYVMARNAEETGVSLPSEANSDMRLDAIPKNSNRPEIFGEVYGSEEGEEFVFEVANPDRFR